MNYSKGNTSNTLLVLILVIIVGFVVWYVTMHQQPKEEPSGVQINLGSDDSSRE